MFWKRLRREAIAAAERARTEKAHYTKLVTDAGFDVLYFEKGKSFDNIVLDICRGTLLLRFVRDRGCPSCEVRSAIMPKAEEWVDYNVLATVLGIQYIDTNDGFDILLQSTLGPANMQAIDTLERLSENRDRYAAISHTAVSLQRSSSTLHAYDE